MMCITLFALIVEFLPFLCVVTVPIYGSFCGIDLILRVSLLLYVYVICSELIPKVLNSILPYLNFGVLVVIYIYIPVNLVPYPVIWCYDTLLWVSEIGLHVAEIVLALNFIMHCSQRVLEKLENEESLLLKVLVILFSSSCYAMAASFGLAIYKEGSLVQIWVMFVVLVLCLAVHNMMWMSHEGILADAAFTCLCSIAVLYAMKEETYLITHPLQTPESWFLYDRRKAMLSLAKYVINSSVENATLALEFLMKFLRPFFLVTLGVRLYSILYIIEKLMDKFWPGQEDFSMDVDEYEERFSPWRSPVIVKLAVIFMFTQMTTNLFYESRGISFARFYPLQFLENFYPQDIIWGRIAQVLIVNCFYIWRLYCAEDWQWNDWFSS